MRKQRLVTPLPIKNEEATNSERAERASRAFDAYATILGEIADESNMRDLITDAMHFCKLRDIDFDHELEMARANFDAEVEESCDACGGPNPDGGDGYDGNCARCADKLEASHG